MRAVHVRVPASTANLGSGFDALGLALGLYDEVTVEAAASGLDVQVRGEGAGQVPLDEDHLLVRAIRAVDGVPDGLIVRCRNTIPHSRGLGSSAAAVVAGVAAGYALVGKTLDDRALQLAAEFEGHADNAAASMLGGLVLAWGEGEKGQCFRAVRLEPHPDLGAIVFVPATESSTKTTRGLLPAQVPHVDAAFAAGRAALAVHAVTVAPELLLPATEDRLHQGYREPAWPDTIRVVEALRAAGLPATVSGAGPTVFTLVSGDQEVPPGVDLSGFRARRLKIDRDGVQVRPIG
ncbi:homoserine kinase [Kutzneria sp. NPDC052558]|uniref:homoserine kinase n=1 Tax=Kutzneria sp. NPDC052558 TaxID=3364121 RepID=UPI0037C50224